MSPQVALTCLLALQSVAQHYRGMPGWLAALVHMLQKIRLLSCVA